MILAFGRHLVVPPQVSGVALSTRATLPVVFDMLNVPLASGVGKGVPFEPELASWTR